MKIRVGLLAILLAAISLAACAASPQLNDKAASQAVPPAAPVAQPEAGKARESTQSSTGGALNLPSAQNRMVIRKADLALAVDDTAATMEQITALANASGGFVVSATSEHRGDYLVRSMTIRVPAESFDETMKTIRGMAARVDADSVQSEDVTEEYSDVDAQIRNLEATEQQYLTLLQKAERIEDILAIQEKLSQVRGDIERLKGRKQFLERSAAMSVITIRLTPIALETNVLEPGWSASQTLREALRGAVVLGQALVSIVIWLIVSAIPLGIIIAPLFLLARWLRRRRRPRAPSGAQ